MHPIERLRYVARATGTGPTLLVSEAAGALAAFGDDPAGLVTACRRLVDRNAAAGPMWWLAARVLAAANPVSEAWRSAAELENDPTSGVLAASLPDEGTFTVLGWPEQTGDALRRGGAFEVLVIDVGGGWGRQIQRLERDGVDAVEVPESGLGAAVAVSTLLLLEASALGPDGFVAASGSRAAAAVARHAGVPVWLVAGAGRVLPKRLWEALTARLDDDEPWMADDEVVPLDLVDRVVGPRGPEDVADAVRRADAPVAPELLKPLG